MEDNKEIKTAAGNIPSAEEQDKNRRKRKTARAALSFGIMVLLLVILFFAAVNIGSLKVTFPQLFRGIFLEPDETVSAIFDLRFPRIMISMLAGAAVAVSGLLFQAVLKNPLADPGIIGISSGASFAAVIITAAAPALFFFTPLFAFLGGVLAFFLVYTLSWKGGLSPLRIILVGVAVNSMFTGLSSAMNSMSGGNMSGVASIVNGNITMKTWEDVQTLVPYVIIGLILSLVFAGKCNLLSLEDKTARSLGVNVNTMRILISLAAGMGAAVLVLAAVIAVSTITYGKQEKLEQEIVRYSENYLRSCISEALYQNVEHPDLMDYGVGTIRLKKVVNTEETTTITVQVYISETYLPQGRKPHTRKYKRTLVLQRARYPQRRKQDGKLFTERECPSCGANFAPDENHCCSFCGYSFQADSAKWVVQTGQV